MKYNPVGEYHDDGLLTEFFAVFARPCIIAAVAAQNSHAQLYNPTGSGIDGQVLDCWVSLPTAGDVSITMYDTALATNNGVGICAHNPQSFPSLCQARQTTNAGILGNEVWRGSLPANQAFNITSQRRWEVTGPHGICVVARAVNIAMNVSWVWYEL